MPSIDERVVEMKFKRDDFIKGVSETLDGIQKLDDRLAGAGGIADNIEKVSSKFNVLGALGFTAIQSLGNSAIEAGKNLVSGVIDPIFEGGRKRAGNLEHANFMLGGLLKNTKDIDKVMTAANNAVDGTAYGLDEAAVAASQFVAARVPLKDMEGALTGISGVAAFTGRSYSDIANIFTAVSGRGAFRAGESLRLQMAGLNPEETLADYYNAMEKTSKHTAESVMGMMKKGEVSFMDFANAMEHTFGEHAKSANDTYTGAAANYRAALGRVGELFITPQNEHARRKFLAWIPLINNFKKALEPVAKVYSQWLSFKSTNFENLMDKINKGIDWESVSKIGVSAMKSVMNLHMAFKGLLAPVKAAFSAIFSGGEKGEGILSKVAGWAKKFENFTKSLILGGDAAYKVQGFFEKLFLKIRQGMDSFKDLGGYLKDAGSSLGDLAVRISENIPLMGDKVEDFVTKAKLQGGGLKGALSVVGDSLKTFVDGVRTMFMNAGDETMTLSERVSSAMETIRSKVTGAWDAMKGFGKDIADAWTMVADAFNGTMGAITENTGGFEKLLNVISPILMNLRDAVADGIGGIGKIFKESDPILLFMGLQTVMSNIMGMKIAGGLSKLFEGIGDGIKTAGVSIGGFFDRINPKVEQTKPTKIFLIAASIAALAASLVFISNVPQDRMVDTALALGVMAGILTGVMAGISKISTGKDLASMPAIATSLAIFSGALLLMSMALERMGSIPTGNLWSAVGAIAAMSAVLVLIVESLNEVKPKEMISGAIAIGILAGAMLLMSTSIAALGVLPIGVILQGTLAVIAVLGALVAASVILSKHADDMILSAVGIMAMAAALNMMVIPITAIGMLPYGVMYEGMANLGIVLAALVIAAIVLNQYADNMVLSAVGLMAMAAALNMMLVPIITLGMLPMDVLVQGILAVTVALLGLALVASMMETAAVGALGMIAIAAAMVILAVAIGMLAALPYEAAWDGLTLMAAGLVTMLAAALVGEMVLPGLLGLAALIAAFALAVVAMGAAMVLAAIGVSIFAATLPLLAVGLSKFGAEAGKIAIAIPVLVALGLALVPLSVAALALGAGMLLLGAGIAILSVGLGLLSLSGPAGAMALMGFISAIEPLLWKIPKLAALSATFLALGAALLVMGAGLILVGAGAIIAAVGLGLLAAAGALAGIVGEKLKTAFSGMEPVAAGVTSLGAAFTTLANSLVAVTANMVAVIVVFSQIGATLAIMTMGILLLASTSSSVGGIVVASFTMMGVGMAMAAALIQFTSGQIVASIILLGVGVSAAAPAVGAATTRMISVMVLALNTGRGLIVNAIAQIVAAFALLAVQLATVSGPSATAVAKMTTSIIKELAKGGILIPRSITTLVKAFGELSTGILQNGTKASTATKTMVGNIRATLSTSSATAALRAYSVGAAIATGLANGIIAGGGRVAAAARTVALTSMNSAKAALGVASPSKEFYKIAGHIIDGYVNGLDDGARIVEKSSGGLGDKTIQSMREAIEEIFEEFEDLDDFDFEPTITPVLDLTSARRQVSGFDGTFGVGGLDTQFSRSQAGSIATLEDALRSAFETKQEEPVQEINYTQNNYSPKALSSADIYRQTKNQISTIRKRRE